MPKQPEELNNALIGIGAACEIAGFMLKQLQENGFTREESFEMCARYFISLFCSGNPNKEHEL